MRRIFRTTVRKLVRVAPRLQIFCLSSRAKYPLVIHDVCVMVVLHPSWDEQSSNRCLLFQRDPPSQRALSASVTSLMVGEKGCAGVRHRVRRQACFLVWLRRFFPQPGKNPNNNSQFLVARI